MISQRAKTRVPAETDERVIELIPENARISYGDTLLNAAAVGGSYKDTLASVTLHESKELLKTNRQKD